MELTFVAQWLNTSWAGIDEAVARLVHGLYLLGGGFMTFLMNAISITAKWGLPLILLSLALCFVQKTRKMGVVMLLSLLAGVLITNVAIKPLVLRPRPYSFEGSIFQEYWLLTGQSVEHDFSFPSGHETAAAAWAMGTLFYLIHEKKNHWVKTLLLILYMVLMGISRIYLSVHYFTDVLAAMIVGTVSGGIGLGLSGLIPRVFYDLGKKKDPEDILKMGAASEVKVLPDDLRNQLEKVAEDTYRLTDEDVNVYFLKGTESFAAIDSGYGNLPLKAVGSFLGVQEGIELLTHGHIDHVLGADQMKSYLHARDLKLFSQHTAKEFLKENGRAVKTYEQPAFLDREHDLGKRVVDYMYTPGHTQGSCVVIDPKTKSVFAGDSLNKVVWLGLEESSSVRVYLRSLKELKKRMEREDLVNIFPGHGRECYGMEFLEDAIATCESILACEDPASVYEWKDLGPCKGWMTKGIEFSIIWQKKEEE